MTSWTNERVSQLKGLWLEGHSAAAVAKELGGVSRNAVIGKVHRLGLSGRAAPSAPRLPRSRATPKLPQPLARPRAAPRCSPMRTPGLAAVGASEPDVEASAARVPLLDLKSGGCRFGLGDPTSAAFGFCAEAAVRGRYCGRHAEIVFQPPSPSRARADKRLLAHLRRA